jgi:N utilization substance protein B
MAKATSSRRAAREMALRVLYTVDIGKQPVEDVLRETLETNEIEENAAAFARSLVAGTLRNQSEIDAVIDRIAVGFPTVRQTAVDRNILRLAAAEVLFRTSDAPRGAVVNEAVELAKKYSTGESGKFVNGVLGTLVREATGEVIPDAPEETKGPSDEEETSSAPQDEDAAPDA